jgi:hypothetical protein
MSLGVVKGFAPLAFGGNGPIMRKYQLIMAKDGTVLYGDRSAPVLVLGIFFFPFLPRLFFFSFQQRCSLFPMLKISDQDDVHKYSKDLFLFDSCTDWTRTATDIRGLRHQMIQLIVQNH